ncbi:Gfo/Idh/MocA family protein [Paenibacillus macerans]|uniref:Gfo/Idh/MocA family protein n=1 Tax=Paenibacillus macerans TaxID=44252 RepID=UPI0020407236|nr:Gfo/Idh/MocA family oxidoreductase [Paenibacillus macerans]MCM3701889.1 Gfo/Idh/MocA family oxidoreductase [Paenibacillus macerans]
MTHSPVQLAIVGGNRGGSFKRTLSGLEGLIRLAAICDIREEVLRQWKADFPQIKTYDDYTRMLEDPEIDAVFIASPMLLHSRQAIEALRAGKHVLSEVIAAHTLEDAWELVETVEQTGLVYMMAENYCFERNNLAIKYMVEQGMFGELTYLEGGYIHDLRHTLHNASGALTWRGELHRDYDGMNYPTHSIGPIAQWLGLNGEGGDRLESMSTFVSNPRAARGYFLERFGSAHPAAQEGYWKQGDTAITNIVTRKGVLITLRVDWTSARPHNMRQYALQGTAGAFQSKRHDREEDLIWLKERSPGGEQAGDVPNGAPDGVQNGKLSGAQDSAPDGVPGGVPDSAPDGMLNSAPGGVQNSVPDGAPDVMPEYRWEPFSRYQPEWDHPLWKRWERQAQSSGHGGGDFLVLEEFASAIHERRKPLIDVYDAAVWSSIFPLSMESRAKNGQPVAFPNFRK